ncbi:hypothetical protein ACP275_02G105700 [Erythranthe tilingii]
MEIFMYTVVVVLCGVFVTVHMWKLLNWAWFQPRKLEKMLREQGFNNNFYRLFIGDYKEMVVIAKQAQSINPIINFSNDIVPTVMPFIHQSVQKYAVRLL